MCNIAGYTGTKKAAPILIEMLKKQEFFDGGLSTGIVTSMRGNCTLQRFWAMPMTWFQTQTPYTSPVQ